MDSSKVVIVTGGGKGIGAEIALHFLSRNYNVVVADVDSSQQQLNFKDKKRFLFCKTDVSSEASVKKLIQMTVKKFGRIDALVNNAGVLPEHLPSIEKMSLKSWHEFIEINLTGAFLCAKYAIPFLRKTKGSIVNMSSTRSLQSEGNDAPYAATKGALVSFTHALAVELGPDVRVNAVSPGWINSHNENLPKKSHQQHPAGRVGKPEDIAAMVEYLISDNAGFITGQNFIVDGGMTVKMIYV